MFNAIPSISIIINFSTNSGKDVYYEINITGIAHKRGHVTTNVRMFNISANESAVGRARVRQGVSQIGSLGRLFGFMVRGIYYANMT